MVLLLQLQTAHFKSQLCHHLYNSKNQNRFCVLSLNFLNTNADPCKLIFSIKCGWTHFIVQFLEKN